MLESYLPACVYVCGVSVVQNAWNQTEIDFYTLVAKGSQMWLPTGSLPSKLAYIYFFSIPLMSSVHALVSSMYVWVNTNEPQNH